MSALPVTHQMAGAKRSVTYRGVVALRTDRKGNLRLYKRRWRVFISEFVYHPAGEWTEATLIPGARVVVLLNWGP